MHDTMAGGGVRNIGRLTDVATRGAPAPAFRWALAFGTMVG
jgi:hypothetical protein